MFAARYMEIKLFFAVILGVTGPAGTFSN